MLIKSSAIDRLSRENPSLKERRFGLPYIGSRLDKEKFNPTVQEIADAIDFYGFGVRDENIVTNPDINLGGGNSMKCEPFSLSIKEMIDSLSSTSMYNYPYTEGDDSIRKVLLDYIEQEGFINTNPYDFEDVDEKGLSIHNLTFLPSTSIAFNLIINIISKPGDVVLITGPNYGLFTIRAERAGAEVEIIPLEKEDSWLVNPEKLGKRIDDINESLERVYNRRKGYVPRVVAFLNANPNNPTGKVMGEKEEKLLYEIGKVCLDRGVFVIDDLVYRDITYDKDNIAKPLSSIPGMFRNTISLFGLSKSFGMASLRAGFVVADEIIIRELINRIFQEMDSSPDIVGRALAGAFNASEERNRVYESYFKDIRNKYVFRYNILKALVSGIDSVDPKLKNEVLETIKMNISDSEVLDKVLKGLPYTRFPQNLEPESGFFAILDFTKLKGKYYDGKTIQSEEDLLKLFYKKARVRFLIGQSISWPYKNELIGRVSFALEEEYLINAFVKMNEALSAVEETNSFMIRLNELEDQVHMAHIKVDGWRAAYKGLVDDEYLDSLNYKEQTERYISSFNDYKDLVFVAEDEVTKEILGYSCFDLNPEDTKYDSELLSLYIKPDKKSQGLGSALFRETARYLLNKDKKNMILWCFIDNYSATKFYEKLGGTVVGMKDAKIGKRSYREVGFEFDLEKFR